MQIKGMTNEISNTETSLQDCVLSLLKVFKTINSDDYQKKTTSPTPTLPKIESLTDVTGKELIYLQVCNEKTSRCSTPTQQESATDFKYTLSPYKHHSLEHFRQKAQLKPKESKSILGKRKFEYESGLSVPTRSNTSETILQIEQQKAALIRQLKIKRLQVFREAVEKKIQLMKSEQVNSETRKIKNEI